MEEGSGATSGGDGRFDPALLTWSCGWIAAILLMLWTRNLHASYLLASAVPLAIAALLYRRTLTGRDPWQLRPLRIGFLFLSAALIVGVLAHSRFEIIEYRWPSLSREWEATVTQELASRMRSIEDRAQHAASSAAAMSVEPAPARTLFTPLDTLRTAMGVDAIAVLSNSGQLIAWAGSHRGRLPDEVLSTPPPVFFAERPLYSYLYYTAAVEGSSRHVVVAVLLESALAEESGDRGVAAEFQRQTGAKVRFHGGHPGMGRNAVWKRLMSQDTIVHARLEPRTQVDSRREAEVVPQLAALILVLLGYALVCAGLLRYWYATKNRRGSGLPLIGAIPLFAIAPIGQALHLEGVSSPELFVLPFYGDITLGSMIAALLPITALAATMRRTPLRPGPHRLVAPLGAIVTGLAFTFCISVMLRSATPALLGGGRALWLAMQVAGVLLLTVISAVLLPRAQVGGTARRRFIIAGVLFSCALSAFVASSIDPDSPTISILAILWSIPFLCFAIGLAHYGGRAGGLARWMAAGWLAATAVVPHLWQAHVEGRLADAEQKLETLGTRGDPHLEYVLEAFAREAVLRYDQGEDGVQLLYRTLDATDLEKQEFEVEILLWSADHSITAQLGAIEQRRLPAEDSLLLALVDTARDRGTTAVSWYTDQPHMSRVLTVPLGNGEVISVVVPPRRNLEQRSGVAFFLGGARPSNTRLYLVQSKDTDSDTHAIAWRPDSSGWRSETVVQFPDGKYHAHLLIALAPVHVRVARAILLVALDLLLLLALWTGGAAARGLTPVPLGAWRSWLVSFRARVTITLFLFFMIPTVVFGYYSYRAVAQEVDRATQMVAETAAEQAAAEFPNETPDLLELASHTGTDVLRYSGGELFEVSSREADALGLYDAWMPPAIYRALESSEEVGAVQVERIGTQRLLTAYHALQASGTLAVPMPLVGSDDTAVRQREIAHLILFAALIGALLSLGLSLAVGRALAGPINELTRASAAVGAGRLRVRLPEKQSGEFGQVFDSFNHMVRRLRRARSREIRTARVLAWGEMAQQVAHEIKNPLTPIKLAVQHMRRAYTDRHPDFEHILETNVDQIQVEIDRLSEIARAFSRYGAPALAAGPLEPVNVDNAVREALTLYRTNDRRLRYRDEIPADLPRVLARPGELKEVLLNLLENARAAIEAEGTITVRASSSDEWVCLDIEDTGSGIPADQLPRIFDPHFSTRSTGTGLGLAIVRRIVESWGGTVDAASAENAGTTISVRVRAAG